VEEDEARPVGGRLGRHLGLNSTLRLHGATLRMHA
jgi:hypothetical protein